MEITEDRRKGRGVTVRRPDKGFPGVLEKTEWDRGNLPHGKKIFGNHVAW